MTRWLVNLLDLMCEILTPNCVKSLELADMLENISVVPYKIFLLLCIS